MDSRIGYLSWGAVYDSSNGNHGIAVVIIVLLIILVMVMVVVLDLVVVGKEAGIGHLA